MLQHMQFALKIASFDAKWHQSLSVMELRYLLSQCMCTECTTVWTYVHDEVPSVYFHIKLQHVWKCKWNHESVHVHWLARSILRHLLYSQTVVWCNVAWYRASAFYYQRWLIWCNYRASDICLLTVILKSVMQFMCVWLTVYK